MAKRPVQFFTSRNPPELPIDEYPALLLAPKRLWNDYNYKTLFELFLLRSSVTPKSLGEIKIYQHETKTTSPPRQFEQLEDTFCSLGQTTEFYKEVDALGPALSAAIYRGLRDLASDPKTLEKFRQEEGVQKSLLRSLGARQSFESRSQPEQAKQPTRFTYTCTLKSFSEPHTIDFEFFPKDQELGRVVALAGKNATGKTLILSQLARAMAGLDNEGTLNPPLPSFSQVVALSYSALDQFSYFNPAKRPESATSYEYCGLRNYTGSVDVKAAVITAHEALLKCSDRRIRWQQLLQDCEILDFVPAESEDFVEQVQILSSGHKIALLTLTNLLTVLRDGSLVLFDEPEIHLHPSMLARLMRALNTLLNEYGSYAIITTHSPQILQEIPARAIRILEREGSVPSVRPYPGESFGANLEEITRYAFGIDEQQKNYQRILKQQVTQNPNSFDQQNIFGSLSLVPSMLLHQLAGDFVNEDA